MGEPRALWERLSHEGWDEVALAGVSDYPWEELLDLVRPLSSRMKLGAEGTARGLRRRWPHC